MKISNGVKQFNNLTILAIETSCDDTGIAVIKKTGNKKPNFKILSNIVSSQVKIHKKYGGVYPTLAKREHQKNLVPVLVKALKQSKIIKNQKSKIKNQNEKSKLKKNKLKDILEREPELYKKTKDFLKKYEKPNIDLIAVTQGPGLEPCLWVGINFAKALFYFWNVPIVGINHIEAHVLVNFLPKINGNYKLQITNYKQTPIIKIQNSNRIFPAICLVISGGHTQLILMKDIGKYKIIGETRDDAAGECFDKCAKILGLEYPGGPIISKLASQYKNDKGRTSISLPRPMLRTNDYDFSFSGLKTAVLYHHKKQSPKTRKSKKYIQAMAYEIQQAIIDVLIKKTIKAAEDYNAKSIILGGGVSANKELRKQFKSAIKKQSSNIHYLTPNIQLSTDNAVMTAIAGYFNRGKKIARTGLAMLRAEANLKIK